MGVRVKRGHPYTLGKKGECLSDEHFFLGGVPRGGGGRRAGLRVTVVVGMLSIDGGRSVRRGGGACVMALGRATCGQCLKQGLVDLEEEDILIIIKIARKDN